MKQQDKQQSCHYLGLVYVFQSLKGCCSNACATPRTRFL